jgi:hypothetical protein
MGIVSKQPVSGARGSDSTNAGVWTSSGHCENGAARKSGSAVPDELDRAVVGGDPALETCASVTNGWK